MNERIKEFTQQVEKWIRCTNLEGMPEDEMTYEEIFNKKFAELIIQECMRVCKSRVGNSDYNTGRMHCVSDLKDHFGIEQ